MEQSLAQSLAQTMEPPMEHCLAASLVHLLGLKLESALICNLYQQIMLSLIAPNA